MRDGSLITLVPVLDAGAYADNDVLFVPTKLESVVVDTKGPAILRSLFLLDTAGQKQDMDLLFFSRDPGDIGAANAALAMSDAEAQFLLGHISLVAADYVDGNANSWITKTVEMLMGTERGSKDIWVAGVVRSGTPTYGVSGLTLKFSWERL